jgi:hypothetical protein
MSAYELRQRVRGPVKLVFLGILIGVGDYAYAEVTGELLRVGPAGPLWLAGPLVIWGIGLGVVRLMRA